MVKISMKLCSLALCTSLTHLSWAEDLDSCSSGNDQQCLEQQYEPTVTELILEGDTVRMITPSALPSYIYNKEARCDMWAEMGLCNTDTEYMLRNCVPACLNSTILLTHGLLTYGSHNKYRTLLSDGVECADTFDPTIHLNSDEEGCEKWAERGECFLNPKFMLKRCTKSCLLCIPSGVTTFPIGRAQIIPDLQYFNQTMEVLIRTANYMKEDVMGSSSYYYPLRATCRNRDSHCSDWSAQGYCDPDNKEFQFMIENCAPACQICHLQDCNLQPKATWKPGDLYTMFERLVGEQDMTDFQNENGMRDLLTNVTIHSRPTPSHVDEEDENYPYVIGGPWVITIDDFLTPEECDFLIEMGHKSGYSRSTETRKDGEDFESQHRTSSNAWCRGECANNPITKRIFEKIYILTGLSSKNGELIQLLQYEPGQFYQSHHDFVAPQLRRVLTFFLYLEDEGLEGGGTQFTNLFPNEDEVISIEIAPKRGRALIWPNVLNEDPTQKDESTFHSGMPVLNGIKYAANVWFHNYDLTKGYNLNC